MNVNATVGDDGKPHVTAIEGHDQHYDQYGRNGLVWIMTPPLYYAVRETSTSLEILISDSKWTGFSRCQACSCRTARNEPACCMPNTWPASTPTASRPAGAASSRRATSDAQNDYIDRAAKLGKGYSGLHPPTRLTSRSCS